MPYIHFRAAAFDATQYPDLQGNGILDATWPELIWAAVTVGRRNWADVVRNGRFSVYEFVYRVFIIYANLLEQDNGTLSRTNAYDDLDPSEKGAVSFFLGMTMGKLFAADRLAVSWMRHLHVYRTYLRPIVHSTHLRPDLVGCDSGRRWLSMEAKGRTGTLPTSVFQHAKRQSRSLRRVRGRQVTCHVAAGTYFNRNATMRMRISDPPAQSHLKLNIDIDDFLFDYYEPVFTLCSSSKQSFIYEDIAYRRRSIPELGVDIGIDERVIDAGINNRSGFYDSVVSILPRRPQPMGNVGMAEVPKTGAVPRYRQLRDRDKAFVGPDGIAIWLGGQWAPNAMQKEPHLRGPQ